MPIPAYCPACGGRVGRVAPGVGRCSGCRREVYAHSRPAAGVFITRGEQVLLVRRGAEPGRGRWDIPGGFLFEGELPEVGARREIMEELGVRLGPLRLVLTGVNPVSEGAVLDILFEGGISGGVPRPGSDVADCAWFGLDDLPEDLAFDTTRRSLEAWLEARRARG
jgi:ADP-ribose pyrophosphatase YjhB (NUDIX family)